MRHEHSENHMMQSSTPPAFESQFAHRTRRRRRKEDSHLRFRLRWHQLQHQPRSAFTIYMNVSYIPLQAKASGLDALQAEIDAAASKVRSFENSRP